MWQCGNVTPCARPKHCSSKRLLHRSNIASVAMLLDKVAMLLADPRADLPYGLQTRCARSALQLCAFAPKELRVVAEALDECPILTWRRGGVTLLHAPSSDPPGGCERKVTPPTPCRLAVLLRRCYMGLARPAAFPADFWKRF